MSQRKSDFLHHSTFVLSASRTVLVLLPKAACTTAKLLIAQKFGVHPGPLAGETHPSMWVHHRDTFHQVPSLLQDEQAATGTLPYRGVTFVRSPYLRLLSAWADKVLLQDTVEYQALDPVECRFDHSLITEFRDFVLSDGPNSLAARLSAEDPHFMPQRDLLDFLPSSTQSLLEVYEVHDVQPKVCGLLDMVPPRERVRANAGLPLNPGAFFCTSKVLTRVQEVYARDLTWAGAGRCLVYEPPTPSANPIDNHAFLRWAVDLIRVKNRLIAQGTP